MKQTFALIVAFSIGKLALLSWLVFQMMGCTSKDSGVSLPQWFIDRGLSGKASWDALSGTLRITNSVNWGGDDDIESFYFQPPAEVKTIVIAANVTVTGGFRLLNGINIKGEDRNTSIIFGTNTVAWARGPNKLDNSPDCNKTTGDDRASDCLKWKYGAISCMYLPAGDTIKVSTLTLRNARTYNITSFVAPIQVDNVYFIEQRTEESISNCDGFCAGSGSSLTNSTFDVTDDAIKLYGNLTVKNVTILAHRNGAPFQLGWGSEPNSSHTLENILVKGMEAQQYYNSGLFSWKSTTANTTRTITINGLKTINFDNSKIWIGSSWVARPLFELNSLAAKLNIQASNVSIQSGGATFPNNMGSLNLSICGNPIPSNSYSCGNGNLVTGNN
ncbi:MAG: hypothetical protein WCO43_01475 [Chitinophagia bacterium]